MTTENQKATDASGGNADQTPATIPEPTTAEPSAKLEIKEGKVTVDGKAFVAESDLIASKKSLEGQIKTQQTAHETAIDAARLEVSGAQKEIATLNAKITENEQAREAGVVTDEEATRVKQELETTKSSLETLSASALELKRANIVLQYGVAPDTIKEKNMAELGSFEEALKAVDTARGGVGPYAIGGGTGEAAPQTPIERAAKILESTPVRGVRNEPQT